MSKRATWMDQPHEFRENVNDGSMCLCGVPATVHHLVERMAALEDRQERFEEAVRAGLMQASMASYKVSGPVRKTSVTPPVVGPDSVGPQQ